MTILFVVLHCISMQDYEDDFEDEGDEAPVAKGKVRNYKPVRCREILQSKAECLQGYKAECI